MSKSPHLLLAEEAPRGEVAASRAVGRPEPHAQTAELAKLDTFSVVGYTPVIRPHSRSALTCQHPLTPPLDATVSDIRGAHRGSEILALIASPLSLLVTRSPRARPGAQHRPGRC